MILLPQIDVDDAAARLSAVREVMRAEYRKKHRDPWVVAYSGGKDSTLLLHLAWEVMLSCPPEERGARFTSWRTTPLSNRPSSSGI